MFRVEGKPFNKIRSYFWPVHGHETMKLVPMLLIMFFVACNYSILLNLKDALVITAEGSGAEVIPFIKLWVMLPAAIGATMLYAYTLNHLPRYTAFQLIIGAFLVYFLLFALFIYPNRDALSPTHFSDYLESILPLGCKGLVAMVRNWTLTCFYVVSELWGTIVLQVLIWGFANEITKITEAPRFYSVMVIVANIAAICAGQLAVFLSRSDLADPTTSMSSAAWEYSLIKILLLIVGFGVAAIFTFRWMNFNVLSDPTLVPQEAERTKKKDKKRLSFRESISFISRSKYLLSIAAIVIGYNLVINLVEVIWKDRLRLLYPSTADYNIYLNNLTSARGVISTVVSILMAGLIHKLGWTKTALITPIIMLLTSLAFFSCLFGDSLIAPLAISFLGMTPLALAVFFGSAQNCFSKAAKYSVFDATKEMAFIPLPSDAKMKGKAAIDGIGSRMAKSGGAVIHSSLLLVFGTLPACAPTVALIIVGISALWIMAVFTLGKEFALQTQAQPKEAEAVT